MTDEIPQEVRAAVRRIIGGYSERQDERWRGLVTWERHDAQAVQILAAVLPRIEQRVIDRLAREAGEPPDEIPYVPGEVRGDTIWKRGVACGVAAERARWEGDGRTILECLKFTRDESAGYWGSAQEAVYQRALAALAPERTTTPEPEGENG